nr:MAG TPA: hypothetical protein [Caudoviricetes sp.]
MTNYVGKKVLVRGIQSGVYFGELVSQDKQEVEMKNVRNLWRWSGANTLLDLAENGAQRKDDCKFSNKVNSIILTDICEIVPCSDKAIKNIEGVVEWTY